MSGDRPPVAGQRACVACGMYHGGVVAGQRCLERAVLELRAEVERLRAGRGEV